MTAMPPVSVPPMAEDGRHNAEQCFREMMTQVMHLVRAHPPEDQRLFQAMFLHALQADDATEVDDAIETMAEILRDHAGKSTVSISAFPQPPLKGEDQTPTEEDRPQTRRLRAWTDFVSIQVKKEREKKGWTQERLADEAGLTQSHISRIEKGVHSPSRKTLVKIAKALGVSLGDLDPVD